MNKHDKDFLKANWDQMKEKAKWDLYKFDLDVSSSCYVTFGRQGMSVFKYRNKRWHRKTVNGWKELTFDEFMQKFNQAEWEEVD